MASQPGQRRLRGVLALVGLRGAGKSSLGGLLAERLGVSFLDLDLEIVRDHGAPNESTGALLERVGEPSFRDLEQATLEDRLQTDGPLVLATGGGVVEREVNRQRLRRLPHCIWLRASIEELARRTASDGSLRPALTDLDPHAERQLLADRRAPLYAEVARMTCETEGRSLDSIALEIFSQLPQ